MCSILNLDAISQIPYKRNLYKSIFDPHNFVAIGNMTVKQGQKLSIRTQVKVLIRSENLKVGKPCNLSIA